MAYQALYRTWRPTTFDDVVGQTHITQTLKNEIVNNKLAHAYLFCGTRGTGKTSTAKILARAVNCENPQNGNPCNECEVCRGILDESILDVVELDGASKNKVENIRDIIDDVVFLPSRARKKVYIIDEVHMVTTAAFNALLKTLEEPPEHVMFILATTELNKIPATVLSRCQRFDFRRITNEDIAKRLKVVVEGSGKSATDDALKLVAELGNGSMRDSLSVLDQCVGFSDETLTYNDVLNIIGITNQDALFSLTEAVSKGDAGASLAIIEEVIANGKELDVFIDSVTKFLRDVLVVKIMENPEKVLNSSQETISKMKVLAGELSKEKLIHCLNLLNDSIIQAKTLTFKRTVYELCIVKMCNPAFSDSYESLVARIDELEQKLKNGNFTASTKKEEKKQEVKPIAKEEAKPQKEMPKKAEAPASSDNTDNQVASRWDEIKEHIRKNGGMPLIPHLASAKPMIIKNRLALVFPSSAMMSKTVASKQGYLDLIKISVQAVTGLSLEVGCFSDKEVTIPTENKEENDGMKKLEELAKKHNIIEIID
ncbi:MAG: DNA polymerase III subunit gamma/tau [Clostridia bacterium]|nr:DNA polymerase III subunit gamma/tau [Clostridia bacterium]